MLTVEQEQVENGLELLHRAQHHLCHTANQTDSNRPDWSDLCAINLLSTLYSVLVEDYPDAKFINQYLGRS